MFGSPLAELGVVPAVAPVTAAADVGAVEAIMPSLPLSMRSIESILLNNEHTMFSGEVETCDDFGCALGEKKLASFTVNESMPTELTEGGERWSNKAWWWTALREEK